MSNIDISTKLTQEFEKAEKLSKSSVKDAIEIYKQIISTKSSLDNGNNDSKENSLPVVNSAVDPALKRSLNDKDNDVIRIKENSILNISLLLKDINDIKELGNLILNIKFLLINSSKAKSDKILRTLVDYFISIPENFDYKITIVKDIINWTKEEKRTLLHQSLETKLVSIYLDSKNYSDALTLISTLLRDLKRLDDKNALIEVQLLESRIYHALRNLAKSRAALTSARTSANAVYCPPLIQAQLDIQSGILHAEEKDYKTAYSYFYETLESFSSQEDKRSLIALKYMLLCKVMLSQSDEVHSIVNSKLGLKWQGPEIEAMKAVAQAHLNRSLIEFEQVLAKYQDYLRSDPIIKTHLAALYETLLEQNLLRLIEPFSRVEISHIAGLVKLPESTVENKLSKMILDKVFDGVLDQGNKCLEIFDKPVLDKTYEATLETIKSMNNVVESLYTKAALLS